MAGRMAKVLRLDRPRALVSVGLDAAEVRIAGSQPRGIATAAAKLLTRSKRRAAVKTRSAAELLEIARKDGRSSRSWQAAILARLAAEDERKDE